MDAPAWLGMPPTANQREVHRQFVARDLPRVEQALQAHSATLTNVR